MLSRVSLRSMSRVAFILNIVDITTDVFYILTRPYFNPQLYYISAFSLLSNSIGMILLILLGYLFNCFLEIRVFKSKRFKPKEFWEDLQESMTLAYKMYTKQVLDLPFHKNKAIYRTSLLIHITLESFPQLIIQCINNSYMNLWNYPLSNISICISGMTILFAFLVTIKTDKHIL